MVRIFGIFLVFVLGVFLTLVPKLIWQLRFGLWIEDAEPTEIGLMLNRVFGVLVIIGGCIWVFSL